MTRASDGVLLLSVCALLVFVLGAAESGAGPVMGQWSFLPPAPAHSQTTQAVQSTIETATTAQTSGGQGTTGVVTQTTTQGVGTSSTQGIPVGTQGAQLDAILWYPLVVAVVSLGVLMTIMLVKLKKPNVIDLKGALGEMEGERNRFVDTWSTKLRNAALLRYYVLLAQVCAKVGIEDTPQTPRRSSSGGPRRNSTYRGRTRRDSRT